MRVVVLDLELTQPSRKIIQIGAIVVNLKTYKIENQFNKITNPGELPSNHIEQLTGITSQMVVQAESFESVATQFWDWVAEQRCSFQLGAWGSDVWKLYQDSCQVGVFPPSVPKNLDIKELAKLFRIPLTSGKKSGGLLNTLTVFGLKFQGRQHNALDDAINTAWLLIYFTKQICLGSRVLDITTSLDLLKNQDASSKES